jgi:hypothetical protein
MISASATPGLTRASGPGTVTFPTHTVGRALWMRISDGSRFRLRVAFFLARRLHDAPRAGAMAAAYDGARSTKER